MKHARRILSMFVLALGGVVASLAATPSKGQCLTSSCTPEGDSRCSDGAMGTYTRMYVAADE